MAKADGGSAHTFQVKTMTPKDFDFAVQITDEMKWNLTASDFEFMVELEPDGCFILFENSKRIGLATTISFGTIGWFGNLIVNESDRKRGGGSQLVSHSVEYLTRKHVKTIGLYAYMDRIHFYERLGFKQDEEVTVLNGRGSSFPVKSTVAVAGKQDLQKIIEFDESCFGASRRRLLESIILDPDNLCCISIEQKRVVGYAVAKVYRQMSEIGPLVWQKGREDLAINLLRSLLSKLEAFEVTMYVPSKDSAILDSLKTLKFVEGFRVIRMLRGSPIVQDCTCMAESLERG
jgi:N-acetylglutamate synthase-like GNAT family acetyltransferase